MTTHGAWRARELRVGGVVQGVGFRPFVLRLAGRYGLSGWVCNDDQGVVIRIEGEATAIAEFEAALYGEAPPAAAVQSVTACAVPVVPLAGFSIRASPPPGGSPTVAVTPDLACCAACRGELFDPDDRRYRYPFINCTQCGPRYSIVERIPYDRPHTTMRHFRQCAACQAEYDDPANRRHHAQPNACPICGPQCEWWDEHGANQTAGAAAIDNAVTFLQTGHVVAVKGIGGFHLMTLAENETAVRELRRRRRRDAKPFAVMFPSLAAVRKVARVDELEATLLASPVAPIVLLEQRRPWTEALAPGNPLVGALLPYAPLHWLLMDALQQPLVATSGNLTGEPLCFAEREAVQRLAGIADGFLVHNRPIARPVDDSIVRVASGRPLWLRRARGLAPVPLNVPGSGSHGPVLAVGGHLKNTVAVAQGDQVIVSQHVGDLETVAAEGAFRDAVKSLTALYPVPPRIWVCDTHPDYAATLFARGQALRAKGGRLLTVQHHHAHAAAVMADNGLTGSALGVIWDGTGYGPDGTVWGGEFLRVDGPQYERVGHFRTFPLPGGEQAIKQPARSALGVLFALRGADVFADPERQPYIRFEGNVRDNLRTLLLGAINAPLTSSAGRLFDAVASLLSIAQRSQFEGQAAMALEFAAVRGQRTAAGQTWAERIAAQAVPAEWSPPEVDWGPLIERLLMAASDGAAPDALAYAFHAGLARWIARVAVASGEPRVVLGGGCFQNRCLLELAVYTLREAGLKVFWPRQIPPNDGGLAYGQACIGLQVGDASS